MYNNLCYKYLYTNQFSQVKFYYFKTIILLQNIKLKIYIAIQKNKNKT